MEASVKKIEKPRVRIAPSPTGLFHVGTARTALFNYLFAKKYKGDFILRMEDTDKERSRHEWEKDILEGLTWLKIPWDEGINIEEPEKYIGDVGPYRQSERTEIYKKYIKKLLDEEKAYHCFCTKEELEAHRQYQMSIGQPARYSGKCRDIPSSTVEKYLKEGKPSVIRFKMPEEKIVFNDLIKGKIEVDATLMGDITIAKDESWPLYNLAVVIDDYEMKISHVLRGEDHISNTPKQLFLQKALELPHPEYGHFPLIMGEDKSKLSKRHGAVSISEYREKGYLAEALTNFMAFLGWNPGGEKEIYPLNVLINEFSLDRCRKSSAMFNLKKLDWLNGFYIRNKSITKITALCLPYLIKDNLINPIFETGGRLAGIAATELEETYLALDTKEKITPETLEKIIGLYQERLKNISEISELIDFFFKNDLNYPKEMLLWKDMDENALKEVLEGTKTAITGIKHNDWSKTYIQDILAEKTTEMGLTGDRGKILWPLRVALSGKKTSAPPFDIAEILGKEKTLNRIEQAKNKLKL
ncbi:MAG: glutamate--tRNA ligase [Patescibacteria group bacterium]|nr:glutamate--tRNA ligase [Patescibacteria group bacterium]